GSPGRSTLPDESRASTTVPATSGWAPPWARTAVPSTGAIWSVSPDGRRRRTVATPHPECTAIHITGEPSRTPNSPVESRVRGAVTPSEEMGAKPWPTAAVFESSVMSDGLGVHGTGAGHGGEGTGGASIVCGG